MVTMHESPDYLLEAIRAGAAGYVLKDASGERLLGAVRRTLEGEFPLDQELAMRLLTRLAKEEKIATGDAPAGDYPAGEAPGEASDERALDRTGGEPGGSLGGSLGGRAAAEGAGAGGLTPREVEVLRLLSRGQTNPQIAQNLLYSVSTVKAHVRSILSQAWCVRPQQARRSGHRGQGWLPQTSTRADGSRLRTTRSRTFRAAVLGLYNESLYGPGSGLVRRRTLRSRRRRGGRRGRGRRRPPHEAGELAAGDHGEQDEDRVDVEGLALDAGGQEVAF
jgi:DNA-binding NarL/FixJ family response regulator